MVTGSRDEEFQNWERISNVARAEITPAQGINATPAMSVRARERFPGFVWAGSCSGSASRRRVPSGCCRTVNRRSSAAKDRPTCCWSGLKTKPVFSMKPPSRHAGRGAVAFKSWATTCSWWAASAQGRRDPGRGGAGAARSNARGGRAVADGCTPQPATGIARHPF